MAGPLAVIEIGSTGLRLLVAKVEQDKSRTLLDSSGFPVNLGKDVYTTGSISRDTLLHILQILTRFTEQLVAWGITPEQTMVIGTNALREANNRDPVVDRIKIKTGYTVKIVDGIEENRLMYLAVNDCLSTESYSVRYSDSIILEVAGASTEVMLIEKGKMAAAHSLRLGTVIIEQQLPFNQWNLDDARRYVKEFIQNTKGSLNNELNLQKIKQFIAVGNDMKLAALFAGRNISKFLWEINRDDFEKFVEDIQHWTVEECIDKFKLSYSEAQTFHISLLIYLLFVKLTNVQKIIVPETSLRDGLIISKSASSDYLEEEFNSQIIASANNLLRKYKGDEKHAECVKNLSLQIFDSMKNELMMGSDERLILETSAILHDIGMFIGAKNHNIHSKYLVENSEIFGLNREEISMIARIVSYHKGVQELQNDAQFRILPRQTRLTILKLSAILRVADALDRSHEQKFKNINFSVTENSFSIKCKNRETSLEKIALKEKGDLFENVFGYKIVLN